MSGAIEKLLDQNEAEATWALPGGKSLVDAARAELAALRADNEEMAQWVRDLQSGMYVNCVYCGHRYGPGETTPVSMADALKAHVEQCPKHPMSALRADNARKAKALEHAASYMVTARMDRPVYEKGDDSMLRGELEGHWQTEDWLIGLRELAEECAAIARESALSTPAPAGAFVTLERMEEIEWRPSFGDEVNPACPACHRFKEFGHKEDCWLAAALRKCIEGGAE